jgi:hypothetical protein
LFYSIDMIELLLPYGYNILEYSLVKATIGICTLADCPMAKKYQHRSHPSIKNGVSTFCTPDAPGRTI